MRWRGKDEQPLTPLQRRLAKIPTPELAGWAHQALYGVGRMLSDWERERDDSLLVEAEQGAEALLAVLREIRAR